MARITPRPYGSSTVPTSVKVKQVIKNGAGDITGVVYTITGGQPPQIGMSSDEKKLSSVNVSNGAPLYLSPGVNGLPVSSFYGATKFNALEHYSNNLYFTLNDGTLKQIAFLDSSPYSGSLSKNILFDKRFFDTTTALDNSTASNTSTDVSWSNSTTSRVILRKAKDLASTNYGDEVNPYSARSPMLVLAGATTLFKITSVEPNYYNVNVYTPGYIKYTFTSDGRLAFGSSSNYFSDTGGSLTGNTINYNASTSPITPVTVTGISYSAYNITNAIPTFVSVITGPNSSSGYFIIAVPPYSTNGTTLPIGTYPNGGFNADTGILGPISTSGATGRIALANISQKRAPSFRRLNGDDTDLTLAPVISNANNILVTDSENVIKKLGPASTTDYFLRGDGIWALPPTGAITSSTSGNTISIFTPDTTSGIRTLRIRPSSTTGRDGNLSINADGSGKLELTGGAAGTTITGGSSTAANTITRTSLTGVSNSGTDSSGPVYIEAGAPSADASLGGIYIGTNRTATSSIIIGDSTSPASASIELNGSVSAPGAVSISGTLSIPGELIFTSKGTTTPANPTTGQAKLYFKTGSTGGTLKLVARFGTKETTILDNIASS